MKENKTNIYNDLVKTKSIYPANIEIFSKSTRDKKNLQVKIDKISGVVFIQDYFVGDSEYFEGVKGSKFVISITLLIIFIEQGLFICLF